MSKLFGVVERFDNDSGYITHNNGGADVFVRSSDIAASEGYKVLAAGQKVSYEVRQGLRGPEAANVVAL